MGCPSSRLKDILMVLHLKLENIPAKNINENIFTYSLTPYG
jgi:hypothetical protein